MRALRRAVAMTLCVSAASLSAATVPLFTNTLAAKLEPTRQLVYQGEGQTALRLHVFEPAGRGADQIRSRPVVIWFHGGGWGGGTPRVMYPFATWAAEHGMVGISAQYRLLQLQAGVTVFDCAADACAAVQYVRAHADELGIDAHRIVVGGASAGGHLAIATALFDFAGKSAAVSCRPDALILLSPVIDTSAAGYGNAKIGARWQELSPVHHVVSGMPPTILFHGTADPVVPFRGAETFQAAMCSAGNRSELVVEHDAQHTYMFKDERLYAKTLRRIEKFLRETGVISPALMSSSP